MKQHSTTLLKAAIIFIGIPVLALTLTLYTQLGTVAFSEALNGATLGYIVLGILALITISLVPFYAALVQAYRLLTFIDHNQAFSTASVKTLNKIKNYALMITGIYVFLLPFVYVIAEWDDAPGLIIVGMVPAFASFVIAVFSAVLKRLFEQALAIQTENELTI